MICSMCGRYDGNANDNICADCNEMFEAEREAHDQRNRALREAHQAHLATQRQERQTATWTGHCAN